MIQPSPQPAQFADRLAQAVAQRRTPVLVGLDPRYEQLPAGLTTAGSASPAAERVEKAAAYLKFCQGVIDVVAPWCRQSSRRRRFSRSLARPA